MSLQDEVVGRNSVDFIQFRVSYAQLSLERKSPVAKYTVQ
ncbi:hypothetical protein SPAR64_0914 [Streptococcus pneumoniae GA40410]|nr:hypothetical protein SPAR64_0914 [Streptococcus pneumoniae GA40410]